LFSRNFLARIDFYTKTLKRSVEKWKIFFLFQNISWKHVTAYCSCKSVNFTQLLRKNGDSTLWKLKISNLTEKKIRQINYLVISTVKMLLSRNFCQKRNRVNFRISTLWNGKYVNFCILHNLLLDMQCVVKRKNYRYYRNKVCDKTLNTESQ